jgi:response regulator NasT
VDSDPERAAAVQAGLTATGCTVVAIAAGIEELTRRARDSGADVIVCGLNDPSRDELEGMCPLHRDEPRPLVLFADKAEPEQAEAVLAAA